MPDSLDDLFGGLESALAHEHPQPFKFLDPYGPEDRAIFFGREAETALLYAQFFKSRLTLVYGESGTGKTSLINCGLRAQIPPEDMLFIPVRTALDPETNLRQELLKQVPPADELPENLEALLREVIWRKHKTLVLVFDQFEEFFLFQPASVRTAFVRQAATWLEHGLDLRLLIGIREEYLARLTELEEYLPDLYQNRLWVRRMSREQAQEAIIGPCRALGIAIEPELVAELLDTLTSGGQGVELPILQVILDTLYRRAAEDNPEHPRLTHAGYQALGQVQNILARFIEDRISAYGDDAEPARQVLKTLVTAEGTRRLSSPVEIQERLPQFGSEMSEEQLMRRLRRLVDDRIVREDADHHLFELRHDALAARIWQWMTGIEQELLEVRQTLEHRLREYRQHGRLLDADVLAYLAPYESHLHLRGELAELVMKSRQQAARRRRRLIAWSIASVGGILLVVSMLALSAYRQLLLANNNLGLALDEKGERALSEWDFNSARLYFLYALKNLDPKAPERPSIIGGLLLATPGYRVLYSINAGTRLSGIAFSPDAQWLAQGSKDGTVRLWEVASGQERAVLRGHTDAVRSIAFSPDGRLLASGSKDGTVRLWEVAGGQERAVLRGHEDAVRKIAFSPDGRLLASGSKDGTVRLWEVAGGQERAVLRGHEIGVGDIAFSPDGQWLASTSMGNTVRLWEVAGGQERAVLRGHEDAIRGIAFSPDSRLLASGSMDNTIRLWEVASGQEHAVLRGHEDAVGGVAFSPDGRWLASGSGDQTVRLWEVASGQERTVLRGHKNPVMAVAFSRDGQWLASTSMDNTVRLWEVASGQERAVLRGHKNPVMAVAFSPDGQRLASASWDQTVRLWEVAGGQERTVLHGHKDAVGGVAFSPNGQWLASASRDRTVRLWEVASGQEHAVLRGHEKGVGDIAFSPNGQWLASASWDQTVRLWEVASGQERAVLRGHKDAVGAVAFSPDGRLLASASWDQTVRLWEVASGQERAVLRGHEDAVVDVAFSPDGQWLASASRDQTVRLWEVTSGKERAVLPGHETVIRCITFSPDGRWLALGLGDNTVQLWEVASRKNGSILRGHENIIRDITFSRDGRWLASTSMDNTVRLWAVASGQARAVLRGHNGAVGGVAFSPNGRLLASGSMDKTVRLWEIGHLEEFLTQLSSTDGIDKEIAQAEQNYCLHLDRFQLVPTACGPNR